MGGGSPAPAPPPPPPDYSSQFAGLRSGQNTIRSDIRATENVFRDEARDLSGEITSGFREQDDRFDDVDSSLTGIQSGMDTGFATVGDQISGLGTDVSNQFDTMGQTVNTGFNNLTNNMNTGFGNISGQVDTRFGELNTGMNTGFENLNTNMGTQFGALGDLVSTGDQALLAGQQEGFAGVNQNVSNVGTNLGNQLTETSSNVLGGQDQIRQLVEQYGGNQDTYYQALSQAQQEAAARQGQLQTGLDQFRGDFDKQNTLANQQRNRIQDAVVGGQAAIREDISSGQQATSQGLSNVNQDLSRVQQDVANVDQATSKNFANVAKMITTGFDDGTQESANLRGEFIDRLTTIRSVLDQQGENIDAGMRETYSTLVNSFDEQGRLIQNSQGQNGEQIARALDEQGNLLLAAFDQSGRRIDQTALDVNRLMAQMDTLGYRPGSNMAMAQTVGSSPANVYSGLASPFTSTR